MSRAMKTYIWLFFVAVLQACTSQPIQETTTTTPPSIKPWLDATPFGEKPELPEEQDIFELSDTQIRDYRTFSSLPKNKNKAANKIVFNYLKTHLDHFSYRENTFIASEALEQNAGNCLSLAIVTKALANVQQVYVAYQLVETDPIYQQENDIIITTQHVRTKLLHSEKATPNQIFFGGSNLIVDYFPQRGSRVLRSLSEAEFYSLFYHNKAAESFIKKDLNKTYWLSRKALEVFPQSSHAINLMALIHSRMNLNKKAEALYQYGIKNSIENLSLLNNYYILLKRLGKLEAAQHIAKQLEEHHNSNPFKWISIAYSAYNAKEYAKATRFYRKALEIAPYLHEAHLGLARVKVKTGNIDAAEDALNQALEAAQKPSDKKRYSEKLRMLSQLADNH